MEKQKYDKGLAVWYFIEQKFIELLIVVGVIFGVYLLGFVERGLSLKFDPESLICDGTFFPCFGTGMLMVILIILGLVILGILIYILYCVFVPLIKYNWRKAKRRAKNGT